MDTAKLVVLKEQIEKEKRLEEENRRLKEWETKFDEEQKKKEEELIRKFYSDNSETKSESNEEKKVHEKINENEYGNSIILKFNFKDCSTKPLVLLFKSLFLKKPLINDLKS